MLALFIISLVVVLCLSLNKQMTGSTRDNGTKNVKIMVSLKYLSNFWRILEMLLFNCEINLILTWFANQVTTLAITDTKLYVPVVTLSTQSIAKLLQQLKSGFKYTINWNKYHSKTTTQNAANQYLDYLISPSFGGVNRFFVLAFNANDNRITHSRYCFPNTKVEDCNVMMDEKKCFDQLIENDRKTYDNIRKITTGQRDDYLTGCLLDYNNFKNIIKQ